MRFVFAHYKFGRDLKSWRVGEELTQADTGELFGVSAGTVGAWERGYNPGILMQNFINACEWMGVDPRTYFVDVTDTGDGKIPF